MATDESAKIEPTLIVADAPSIAETAKPEVAADAAKPEIAEAMSEKPVVAAAAPEDLKTEAAKIETPKIETPKIEAKKSEAPTLPPAPQIDPVVVAFKKLEPAGAAPAPVGRNIRFALLAACVAIAASIGAVAGSLAVARFAPMFAAAPPAAAPAPKEQVADEVKALKDNVAQLRTATRALNENFAALKSSVASAGVQNGRIAETLERIEKAQTEQRKTAAAPAPTHMTSTTQATADITGSIAQQKQTAVPMVLGDPPSNLRPMVVPGWSVRRVLDGAALIEGRDGIIEVEPGMIAPGLGRVEAIKRQDGRWVVVTARGLVVQR